MVDDILMDFEPVTLEEMTSVKLMNRTDTKFITTLPQLCRLLKLASAEYRIQQVNDKRNLPYYTLYYDTPDHSMFLAHQRGRSTRQKVRIRSYVDSGVSFLEVKNKNNKGRTDKQRIRIASITLQEAEAFSFLSSHVHYAPECLKGQLENRFHRITLVNRKLTERLTIDTDLCFHNLENNNVCTLHGLVIIELKRDGNMYSPVREMLRGLHIHPAGFSKYCMGSVLTDSSLKQNRFKPRLCRLERMLGDYDEISIMK